MSPEQWLGSGIDHLTDIWACGLLLHQMICGCQPLPAGQIFTIVKLEASMPSMAEAAPPGVPCKLIQVVDRCLCKRKEERWPSATELLAALEPFLPGLRTLGARTDRGG
jgi:serine/threonine protein kinase